MEVNKVQKVIIYRNKENVLVCSNCSGDGEHFEDMVDGMVLMSSKFRRGQRPKGQNAQQTM